MCAGAWNMTYMKLSKESRAAAHISVSPAKSTQEKKDGDVVIVTDCAKDDKQLNDMIDRFRAVLNYKSRVVNIRNTLSGGV